MALTQIPVVTAAYQGSTLLNLNSAAIAVNITSAGGMYFVNPKTQTIVFYVLNYDMSTSTEVTVTGVLDQAGRGDSTCDNVYDVTVAAGQTIMFGPFNPVWWNQPNGVVNVGFSATADDILVIGVQIA